jgi:prepilin-type processing-associated H-X9-DG protein
MSRENMQRSAPASPTDLSAFTLVEVMVVLAVVMLMAALAVPAVGRAMESGERSRCAGHMRSIGHGIQLYAADHHGRLPSINCIDPDTSWIEQLQPYLGTNYTAVRVSPADPRAAEKLRSRHATSYLLNERVEADAFADENGQAVPGEAVFDRLAKIPHPSQAIIVFLGNTNRTATGTDHIHSGVMRTWNGLRREIWPDAFGGGAPDGTKGSANYLFADGHVQNIAAATLKERVDAGQDITVKF